MRRGNVLYILNIDVTTALGATQGAVSDILADKRSELAQTLERDMRMQALDKQALQARLADLQREIPQIDEQLRLLAATVSEFSGFAERQKDLMERGIVVSAEHEQRLRAFYAERAQLPALRRERVQADSRLTDLQAELAAFDLRSEAQAADIRRQILDINQQISESEARREVAVTAPRDGSVMGIITLTHVAKLPCVGSSGEFSAVARKREQTNTLDLQDQDLVELQRSTEAPRIADDRVRSHHDFQSPFCAWTGLATVGCIF